MNCDIYMEMSSDEENQPGSSKSVSARVSTFKPKPDDPEQLFTIVGIIAERKGWFKVKWEGINPLTNQPWADSWVPVQDVTDDSQDTWYALSPAERRRMTQHEERLEKEQNKRPKSTKSRSTKRASKTKSTAKTRASSTRSVSGPSRTVDPDANAGRSISTHRSRVKSEPTPATGIASRKPPTKSAGGKNINKRTRDDDSSDFDPPDIIDVLRPAAEPANKKRKLGDDADADGDTEEEEEEEEDDESEGKDSENEVVEAVSTTKKRTSKTKSPEKPKKSTKPVVARTNSAKNPQNTAKVAPNRRAPTPDTPGSETDQDPESEVEKVVVKSTVDRSKPKTTSRPKSKPKSKRTITQEFVLESDDEPVIVRKPPVPRNKSTRSNTLDELSDPPRGNAPARHRNRNEAKTQTGTNLGKSNLPIARITSSKVRQASSASDTSDEDDTSALLSTRAEDRLQQFDQEMDNLDMLGWSETASNIPYGESDVDTEAADIMYPREPDEELALSRHKGKGRQREDSEVEDGDSEEVPETQSIPQQLLTPSRASLKSQMKPKTPRSNAASKRIHTFDASPGPLLMIPNAPANGILQSPGGSPLVDLTTDQRQKTLHPIPRISPSKFTPHLTTSSHPSTIENVNSQGQPQSSAEQIEEFESPEKPGRLRVVTALSKDKGKGKARAESPPKWSGSVLQLKGQEMAEKARLERLQREQGLNGKRNRAQLEDILARRSKDPYNSPEDEHFPRPGFRPESPFGISNEVVDADLDLEYVDDVDESRIIEVQDSFEEAGGSNPDQTMDDDEMLDLPAPEIDAIPQEEEESTQDLLHELEVQRAVSENIETDSPSPEPEEHPQRTQETDVQDISMEPQAPATQRSSVPPLLIHEKSPPKVPSRESSKRRQVDETLEIPATGSSNQDSSQDTNNSVQAPVPYAGGSKELEAAMSLLNVKSEEISSLEKLLAEERLKVQAKDDQIAAFKEQTLKDNAAFAASIQDATARLEPELQKAKAAHEADTAKWEEEKFHLQLSIKTAGEQKALAERDAAYFRDLYMQASASSGLLQTEKKELEKELAIAKKQATEGVAAVRETLNLRIKDLQTRHDNWMRTAQFVIEKDRRTNDDIRKRAAEEPELRAKIKSMKQKCATLAETIHNLQNVIQERDSELEGLEGNLADARNENRELKKLRALRERDEGSQENDESSPSSQEDESESSQVNGTGATQSIPIKSQAAYQSQVEDPDDQVYRCEWKASEEQGVCNSLHRSHEELQVHMLTAGHLRSIDTLD
ncbi:hypothetical protein FA15DRAFT_444696 [Coprinopsis marcescibilis]|uniref:Chromo domain-containing protein n=1 Tax=Coprinopsis marcescibilis TaxID=230819 RepID=A0A5C3KTD6_COPMA|nr:hypothetical protein FA15DRAFT_444696 [Coprinopsis marcescibilis]